MENSSKTSRVVYNVCLENYSDTYLNNFCNMLKLQKFVDVTIQCCDDKCIKVHRAVLAANSTYFWEILGENNEMLIVYFDLSSEVIMPIVEFIYYGRTSFRESEAREIISVAKFFNIKGLSDMNLDNIDEKLPTISSPKIDSEKLQKDNLTNSMWRVENDVSNMKYYTKIPFRANGPEETDGEEILAEMFAKKRGRPQKNPAHIILKNMNLTHFSRVEEESRRVFNLLRLEKENAEKEKNLIEAINSISERDPSFLNGDLNVNFTDNCYQYEEAPETNGTEPCDYLIDDDISILMNTEEANDGDNIACFMNDSKMEEYVILDENY